MLEKRFKAILFDKDGTLVDFNGTWLALYEKLALEVAEGNSAEAERLLQIGGFDRARNRFVAGSELAAGTSQTIARLWVGEGDAERIAFWKARMDQVSIAEGAAAAVPVPALEATLARLHAEGRALAVVTNDSEAAAHRTVSALKVSHFFTVVLGFDSVRNPKPAADPVHLACSRFCIEPHQTVVVGDNLHDIEMARNAGAGAAIGVLTGTTGREELEAHADAVLPSIADLPQWLASIGR